MAPKEWATQPQLEYLRTMLPKYRDARAGVKEKSLARFWLLLDDGWFSRYPVEAELGIIVSGPGAEPLTPDELKLIGDATTKMKKVSRFFFALAQKYILTFYSVCVLGCVGGPSHALSSANGRLSSRY
jgi:hypothetical protein